MADPITWRNVRTTVNGGGAGSLMRGAQDSISTGFGALQGVLDQYQETQANNWDVQAENNTQDFMNQLSQYRTPEEFEAARQRGELQGALQGYGRQVDQEAARTALETRLGTLQERETQSRLYTDDTQERANRPLRGQIIDRIYDGDVTGANALFDENRDQFVNPDKLRKELFGAETARRGENRAQAGERRAQAGERRAQENQGFRREDQGWTRRLREREEAALDKTDFANGVATDMYEGTLQQQRASQQQTDSIASQLGLPMTEDGNVDSGNLSGEQQDQLRSALEANGIGPLASDTELRDEFERSLRSSEQYDFTNAEIAARVKAFDQTLANRGNLATRDQGEQTRALEGVEAQHEALKASNPFVTGSVDPVEETNRILGDLNNEDPWGPWSEIRSDDELPGTVEQSMNQGIEIDNESFVVPPGVAEMVLNTLDNAGGSITGSWSGDYEEGVRELLDNPARLRQIKEAQQLNSAFSRAKGEAIGRSRQNAGQAPASVDRLLDTLYSRSPEDE